MSSPSQEERGPCQRSCFLFRSGRRRHLPSGKNIISVTSDSVLPAIYLRKFKLSYQSKNNIEEIDKSVYMTMLNDFENIGLLITNC